MGSACSLPRRHTRTDTDTQTHRHTDTQTHRHTDTQTHRHTDTQTHRHTDTRTHGHTETQTHRHTETQTHRHTDTQTPRHTDTPTHGHTDTRTHRDTDTQTHRDTDTQTHRHTDTQTHRHTETQRHRHTDTQTHRHTDTQTHRHTDTQTHRHTDTRTHGDTDTQTHRDTDTQTHRHTETQTHRHTDTQRHRDTETQTHRHTDTQKHRHTDTQRHRHTDTQRHRHTDTHPVTKVIVSRKGWRQRLFQQAYRQAFCVSWQVVSVVPDTLPIDNSAPWRWENPAVGFLQSVCRLVGWRTGFGSGLNNHVSVCASTDETAPQGYKGGFATMCCSWTLVGFGHFPLHRFALRVVVAKFLQRGFSAVSIFGNAGSGRELCWAEMPSEAHACWQTTCLHELLKYCYSHCGQKTQNYCTYMRPPHPNMTPPLLPAHLFFFTPLESDFFFCMGWRMFVVMGCKPAADFSACFLRWWFSCTKRSRKISGTSPVCPDLVFQRFPKDIPALSLE